MLLTNDQLGERLGVSHAMASRLRNGRRRPSIRVIDAIHREFGVPVEELHAAHVQGAEAFGELLRRILSEAGSPAQAA